MTLYQGCMVAMLVFLILVTGGLMAITPWLMRRNECFAVTVPAGKQHDPRLVALKRRYTRNVLVLTAAVGVIMTAVFVGGLADGEGGSDEALITGVVLVGVLVPLVFSFALMLANRRKVQEIKAAEGWFAERQQVVAMVCEEDAPRPISIAWNLLYLPIVLASLALCFALYPSMPDAIPMHVDFSGEVTDTMEKGIGVFAFPVLITAFLAATMTFSHWTILRSKKPTDVGSPATSAFAYGMFARAQSIFLVGVGLVLAAAINAMFILSSAGIVSLTKMAAVVAAISVFIVIAGIVISVVYGQAGSKLHARMQGQAADVPLSFDDDEHWILGIFYFNRDDASLFLPERFGVGWTLNLARPAVWAILIGFVVVTAVFVVAVISLT